MEVEGGRLVLDVALVFFGVEWVCEVRDCGGEPVEGGCVCAGYWFFWVMVVGVPVGFGMVKSVSMVLLRCFLFCLLLSRNEVSLVLYGVIGVGKLFFVY